METFFPLPFSLDSTSSPTKDEEDSSKATSDNAKYIGAGVAPALLCVVIAAVVVAKRRQQQGNKG